MAKSANLKTEAAYSRPMTADDVPETVDSGSEATCSEVETAPYGSIPVDFVSESIDFSLWKGDLVAELAT